MKKDDNSGVSIKQIMITAMFLVVTTFGGVNIYRIAYYENADAIQTIESANLEKTQFESALVENTEDDFIYRENIKYLATSTKPIPSGSTTSRGNLVRDQNISDIVEDSVSTDDNKLLNSVLNGIKEISEKQEAMINNTGLTEKQEISEKDKLTEAHQTVNNEEKSVNEEITVSEKLLANKEITSDEENKVSEETKNIAEIQGIPTEYVKTIDVKATAYCLCKKCCGKSPSNPNYGVTASGLRITPGIGMKVVASDPSIIPLGTEVYIEGLYGAKDYGYAVVADTGSAIKNLKIDLYMDTHQMALNWGVKTVRVYILGK